MHYLGIDYGLKKVGLSMSEGQIASPFKVLEISGLKDAVNKISGVIEKESIDRVVIGVPDSGQAKNAVKKFVSELKIDLKNELVSIIEADETLSSKSAQDLMISLDLSKEARKKEDAYAAVIILQNFLDSIT